MCAVELEFCTGTFDGRGVAAGDLVVVPLAYEGQRSALDGLRGHAAMITHDWLWRSSRVSRRVSFLLWKRVNLHLGPSRTEAQLPVTTGASLG